MASDENKPAKDWEALAQASDEQAQEQQENSESAQSVSEDADVAGILDHPSYRALEEKLTKAEQDAHEHWNSATRAMAEVENMRRRTTRDVENAHKYATEKFITELLPIIDSLEQALEAAGEGDDQLKAMREGIELTHKMFLSALEKFSVSTIDPVGETFDPNLHEAMSMQDAEGAESNTVLVVFQKGYQLHDRVIRPARVVVAK